MPKWTSEQLAAINEDNKNIIVSAGAGSGKTAVLTERVLRKIKNGVHINELLILTFTNAAAKEMKDRIRKKLKQEGFENELKLIDSAYITTFDSYSLQILKKYHYILNVSNKLKIIDNDLIIYLKQKYLNEIFDEYYNNEDELFIKLINDFCNKDDEDLKKSILDISSKLDLRIDCDEYLNNYINEYFSDRFLSNVIDDYCKKLKKKIDGIGVLLYNLSFYVDGEYLEKINTSLSGLLNYNNYNDIKQNVEISLPRLVSESEEAKKIKQSIKNEIDELKKVCVYEDLTEIKKDIIKTKDYVTVIIDIIKELNSRLNSFKYKNDLYEFIDIAKLSIRLLKENEEVRNEIRDSLNEIMIDEYQDTNDIQEEFISLIQNNNVYMVGDVKQSIYRFRNANTYLFMNKYELYSKNENGIKIDLNKNFRSREETLDDINKIFNLIMDTNIGGASYKYNHQMIFGNNSYNDIGKTNQNNNLEIYNYNYDKDLGYTKEEVEIFIIANDIKEKIKNDYKIFDKDELKLRNARYDDFVILLDRSKDFNLYKKIFDYLNIPLSIYKDETINDEMLLVLLKNIILTIKKIKENNLDNDFRHYYISIVRSFLFEYSDEKIFDLFLNNSFKEDKLYKELRKINIDSITVKELLYYIIDNFDIIANLNKIGDVNNNLTLLEYIINYVDTKEEIGYTPYDFADYLEDIISKNYDINYSRKKDESNSVKIMTIHKSKGLEYSICYYAGLYNKFNISEIKERFLFDNKYGIVTPFYEDGICETIYKYLIKENSIKEEISEKIRLFYVALTRAKEKMIIISDYNNENLFLKNEDGLVDEFVRINYRSFLDILLSIKNELDKYAVNKTDIFMTKDYEKKSSLNINNINKSNIKLDVKELVINNSLIDNKHYSKVHNKILSKEEISNMSYGIECHNIFETEDFNNPKNNLVKRFLEKYNYDKSSKIYKEYEFIFNEKNTLFHGIIDLMFEYEEYIDIIDYKLKSINDEAYTEQLIGYKKYIENKTNKKVNIYLYSIIDNKLKKIDMLEVLHE